MNKQGRVCTEPEHNTHGIRKKIRLRKKVFRKEGRSKRWKELKRKTDQAIRTKQEEYYRKFKDKAVTNGDPGLYYKADQGLKDKDKPEEFNIMRLANGKSREKLSEDLRKVEPVTESDTPPTCSEPHQWLTASDIAWRLRKCKKPASIVSGDIFPDMIVPLASVLPMPLENIFNHALKEGQWPTAWKRKQ